MIKVDLLSIVSLFFPVERPPRYVSPMVYSLC